MYTPNKWAGQIASLLLVLWLAGSVHAGPAEDQYAVAADHYRRGRWELAADEFGRFLQQFPNHRNADAVRFFSGEALVQLQRYAEARPRFQQFLERAPDHRFARQAEFRLGETAFLSGDHPSAEGALRSFHEKYADDPLNAYALAYLGEMALLSGGGEQAETYYGEALQRFPGSPLEVECRFGMARALELQDKSNEAVRFYQHVADTAEGDLRDDAVLHLGMLHHRGGRFEDAVNVLANFSREFPGSELLVDAQYWSGASYLALEDWPRAAETLGAAAVSNQDPEHPLAATILFSLADALRHQGEWAAAAAHLQRLVDTWPDSDLADDALRLRVRAAFADDEFDQVQLLSAQLLRQYPESPYRVEVLQMQGRGLLKQGAFGKALMVLEELAAELSGTSTRTPDLEAQRRATDYYLGLAYLGAERHEEAVAAFDRVTPEPDEVELRGGLAVARGTALVALERFEEAIGPLRQYLEEHPDGTDQAEVRAKLIVALAKAQRWDEAFTEHGRLQQDAPSHALFLPTTEYLARTLHAHGELEPAAALYRALTVEGSPPKYVASGLSGLGKLQLEQGDSQQSSETFQKLLDQKPADDQAAEAAFLRAKSLQQQDQLEAALGGYYAVFEQFPASAQAVQARYWAAHLHSRLKQYPEARRLFTELLETAPDFDHADAARYQLAWTLVDMQQGEEADRVFEQLVERHADSSYWADALYRLAERAVAREDYGRADELLQKLLTSDAAPRVLSHGLYLQGQVAANQQRWNEVLPPMRRIVGDFPDSPLRVPAAFWIAEASYRLARYDAAADQLEALSSETSDLQAAWAAMIPLRRAQIHAQKDEWDQAHELAAGIAERYPQFEQLFEVDYLLGRCLASQARMTEARAAYQRVLQSEAGGGTETAAMAQWMIGETFFHQKEYDEAIKAYHRVTSLFDFPRWRAAALLQAGKCHELKGEWKQAVQLYSQLLQEHPDSPFAEEAARRLEVARASSGPTRTE